MISENLPLSFLTRNKLERVVTAVTRREPAPKGNVKSPRKNLAMLLPALGETAGPEFNGRVPLGNIQFSNRNLPAVGYLMRHVESRKREKYAPPTIQQGALAIRQQGDYVHIDITGDDISDPYVITVQGSVSVDENDRLTGHLAYGLPVLLTQAEYPDAKSDPLFIEDHRLAWLRTQLRGTAETPMDNADELEQRAAEARKTRCTPNSLVTPPLSPGLLAPAAPGTSGAPAQPGNAEPAPQPADPSQEDIFLRTLQPSA